MDKPQMLDHLHRSHGYQWDDEYHDGYLAPYGSDKFIAYDSWMTQVDLNALEAAHKVDHAEYDGGGGLHKHHHTEGK